MSRVFRVGTRGSALAVTQTNWVVSRLRELRKDVTIEVITIKTTGDIDRSSPLPSMGGRGVFVKEVEEALFEKRVDIAVHSMKDLPGQMSEGLQISAVPEREDPRDCLITKTGVTLAELPLGSRVGTGSPRRRAQLAMYRPDLRFMELRGNVDTRLRKLEDGEYDAIILAMAGLARLGYKVGTPMPTEISLPAVGQGALAVQTRSDDHEAIDLVQLIDHTSTRLAVEAERMVLAELGGGCHTPIAALGRVLGNGLQLTGVVADTAGKVLLRIAQTGIATEPGLLGKSVASALLGAGAANLI